jgi:hypothetical protein
MDAKLKMGGIYWHGLGKIWSWNSKEELTISFFMDYRVEWAKEITPINDYINVFDTYVYKNLMIYAYYKIHCLVLVQWLKW